MSKLRSRFSDDDIRQALHGTENYTQAAQTLGISRQLLMYWLRQLDTDKYVSGYEPKIFIYDIETSPMIATVWSYWKQNIPLDGRLQDWFILTWAGKWFGSDEILSDSCINYDFDPENPCDKGVVQTLWKCFDEADIVVAYNGNKFDQKKANARFIIHGLPPPRPYKQIDPMLIAKANFAFGTNRLENVAQSLCGYGKLESGGLDTWVGCLKGDKEAWDAMLNYNIGDVQVLEDVWVALAPWDKRTPSYSTFSDRVYETCTNVACGSADIKLSGQTVRTGISEFIGYTCNSCGHHMRGRKNIRDKQQMRNTLVNAN